VHGACRHGARRWGVRGAASPGHGDVTGYILPVTHGSHERAHLVDTRVPDARLAVHLNPVVLAKHAACPVDYA